MGVEFVSGGGGGVCVLILVLLSKFVEPRFICIIQHPTGPVFTTKTHSSYYIIKCLEISYVTLLICVG